MALPVAKINVKLGPTELGSEASSQLHAQKTFEVPGRFSNACVNILFGHFYKASNRQASRQNL